MTAFAPYVWEPVHYAGHKLRLTYRYQGEVEALWMMLAGDRHDFTVGDGTAELVIPDEVMAGYPDAATAQLVIQTGGSVDLVCTGHLVRRQE